MLYEVITRLYPFPRSCRNISFLNYIDNRFLNFIFRSTWRDKMKNTKNSYLSQIKAAVIKTKIMTRYTPESASGLQDT